VLHTAVKIAPNYSGTVVYVKDASKSVGVVSNLLSNENKADFVLKTKKEYETLRNQHADIKKLYLTLEQARANKLKIDWTNTVIQKPKVLGVHQIDHISLREIAEYVDWTFFFMIWEFKRKFPEILDDPEKGEEARKLFIDAKNMLNKVVENNMLQAKAVYGIFPANSVGDDIEVYTDESRTKVLKVFYNLRKQSAENADMINYCLADFIAPKESGVKDYIGAFAVTAGMGIEKWVKQYEADFDDYNSIMIKGIADRLAEALAEYLHLRVRKEFWGYATDEQLAPEQLFVEKYKGIRPAHGYPACPDHSEKKTLFELLDAGKNTGIELTESFMMFPAASVSGLYFANPNSKYFAVGRISKDQAEEYARRKGVSLEQVESWLASNINYQ
jgi:5-methyltetrahydrofolate--homocysteine methyltransferase